MLRNRSYFEQLYQSGQSCILYNLRNSLAFVNPAESVEIQKELTSGGHCFGFSVLHGAMEMVGKLDWWENLLVIINNWNGHPEFLNYGVILPGSVDKTPVNVGLLFNKVIHYIISNHCFSITSTGKNIYRKDDLQEETLKDFFEILDSNNEIKRFQTLKTVAGNFTTKDLELLLDENSIEDNLCLISCSFTDRINHVIRLGYKQGIWTLYDPNYNHQTLDTIHKIFTNKAELISEIIRIVGPSIAVNLFSFDIIDEKEIFPHYENIIKYNSDSLCEGFGLHILTHARPDILLRILAEMSGNPTKVEKLVAQLTLLNQQGMNVLNIISSDSPQLLLPLLSIISQAEHGPEQLLKSINSHDCDQLTFLTRSLIKKRMNELAFVLHVIKDYPLAPDYLANSLSLKTSLGYSGLYLLISFGARLLPEILQIISKSFYASSQFVNALNIPCADGRTPYHLIQLLAKESLTDTNKLISYVGYHLEMEAETKQRKSVNDRFTASSPSIDFNSSSELTNHVMFFVNANKKVVNTPIDQAQPAKTNGRN